MTCLHKPDASPPADEWPSFVVGDVLLTIAYERLEALVWAEREAATDPSDLRVVDELAAAFLKAARAVFVRDAGRAS